MLGLYLLAVLFPLLFCEEKKSSPRPLRPVASGPVKLRRAAKLPVFAKGDSITGVKVLRISGGVGSFESPEDDVSKTVSSLSSDAFLKGGCGL
jgi:hypothetical protein